MEAKFVRVLSPSTLYAIQAEVDVFQSNDQIPVTLIAIISFFIVNPKIIYLPFVFRPVSLRTASSAPSERGDRTDSSAEDNFGSMLRNNWAMTKTAQYRKLKSDWKNIVLLSKSRIQGLGLFATRDIDAVSSVKDSYDYLSASAAILKEFKVDTMNGHLRYFVFC